ALVLDESEHGTISAQPAASFLRALPELTVGSIEPARRTAISALARALEDVHLAAPAPFTGGELLPIGMNEEPVWPFPQHARRQLAISPFLTRPALGALAPVAQERTLVSRPETLDLIGADAVSGWDVAVLQRLTEPDALEAGSADAGQDGFIDPRDGLHAKTFVLDLDGSRSQVITGSANLTASPWGRNVEFGAVLYGPTDRCGVAACLHGSADVPGLHQILQSYSPATANGVEDDAIAQSYRLERFHQQLATTDPILQITAEEDAVTSQLTLPLPQELPGDTKIWPIALPKEAHARNLAESLQWYHAAENISPFLAVETTLGSGDQAVVRRCIIKARLTGQVPNRRREALLAHLQSQRDLLRYLVFLLGDPAYDALLAQLDPGATGSAGDFGPGGTNLDVPLMEPLVRAAGRDEAALSRVAALMQDVAQAPGHQSLVPEGFEELWQTIWQVHQERES